MKANIINRTALTVKPKQPFIDWANSLDDDGPKLNINDPHYEPTVYLIDEAIDDRALSRILSRHYSQIFENELAGWHLVVEDWPEKRDGRTFKKWFEVTVSTMVLDLSQRYMGFEEY